MNSKYKRLITGTFFALMLSTSQAQAGLLELLFPALKKDPPNVHETLIAPFAEDYEGDQATNTLSEEEIKKATLPVNASNLDKPHRQLPQISAIVSDFVSESLLIDANRKDQMLEAIGRNFSANGKQQYMRFLQENNMIKTLDSKAYNIRSFVIEEPTMLNNGVVSDRYRWLYEAPVLISYIKSDMNEYDNKADPINLKMLIRLQVGRSEKAQHDSGLLIETWSGKVIKD